MKETPQLTNFSYFSTSNPPTRHKHDDISTISSPEKLLSRYLPCCLQMVNSPRSDTLPIITSDRAGLPIKSSFNVLATSWNETQESRCSTLRPTVQDISFQKSHYPQPRKPRGEALSCAMATSRTEAERADKIIEETLGPGTVLLKH